LRNSSEAARTASAFSNFLLGRLGGFNHWNSAVTIVVALAPNNGSWGKGTPDASNMKIAKDTTAPANIP
jgi:hypothetical protein